MTKRNKKMKIKVPKLRWFRTKNPLYNLTITIYKLGTFKIIKKERKLGIMGVRLPSQVSTRS